MTKLSSIQEQIDTTDAAIIEMMEANHRLREKITALEFTTQTCLNECVVYEKMIQQARTSIRTAESNRNVLGTLMTRAKIESQLMKTRVWSNEDWSFIDDDDLPYFAECAIKAAEYDLQMELELAKDIMLGLVV